MGQALNSCPSFLLSFPVGFLGEGDAVTKAIQDARQLLHSHSGALDSSPNTPFRKVGNRSGGRGEKNRVAGHQRERWGGKWGDRERLMYRLLCQSQDLISLDMSPVKERLEETCVHPLEEAMLGCDVDGEALDPELLGWRARLYFPPGQVMSVGSLMHLSVLGLLAWPLAAGHPWVLWEPLVRPSG